MGILQKMLLIGRYVGIHLNYSRHQFPRVPWRDIMFQIDGLAAKGSLKMDTMFTLTRHCCQLYATLEFYSF
jgi:hypothetical protein